MNIKRLGTGASILSAGALSVGACAVEPNDPNLAAVSVEEQASALVLADAARCEAGRFATSIGSACASNGFLLRAAALGATTAPVLWTNYVQGVQLPATEGGFGGAVELDIPADGGNYLIYLGTPNVDLTLRGVDEQTPLCSAYLPLVQPEGYTTDCGMRGAYEFALKGGRYKLELGPLADSSYVRVYVTKRRAPGDTLSAATCTEGFDTTLTAACAKAQSTTPINAARPGGAAVPISAGVAYGVHLKQAGDVFEGELTFHPPHTGDYVVYTGTPNEGVAVSSGGKRALVDCALPIADGASCPTLKAGFRHEYLTAGVPYRIELGPNAPSWVRVLVEAEHPDSDGDGVADNYDLCYGPDDLDFCCADSTCSQATFLGEHQITSDGDSLFQASGILPLADGSYVMAGTTAVIRDIGYGDDEVPQGSVVRLNSALEIVPPTFVDSPVNYTSFIGWGAEVARDSQGNFLLLSRLGSTEDYNYRASLSKLSPTGTALWTASRSLGYNSGRWVGLAVDSTDSVVLAGTRTGESGDVFDSSFFVNKYSPVGTRLFSVSDAGLVTDVAVDANDDIYTAGALADNVADNVVVSKRSSSGALLRSTTHSGSRATSIATSADGSVVVAGVEGAGAAWVMMLDPTGNELWRHSYVVPVPARQALVAVAPNGSVAFATVGDGMRATAFAYDSNGNRRWRYARTVASQPTGLAYATDGTLSLSVHDGTGSVPLATQVLRFAP